MLSDVLSKTVGEIARCLEAYPECYGGMAERIKAVREEIDDLRNEMDCDTTV
jgi:hypothetical protein